MTTRKQTFSRRNSGNVAAAQRNSAEKKRCPKCNRKSALKFYSLPDMFGFACRWPDCGYESMTMRGDEE